MGSRAPATRPSKTSRGGESAAGDAGDVVNVDGMRGAKLGGSLAGQLEALTRLGITELRLEWRRLFRVDPPRLSRDLMTRAIAHRLQEIAEGGLAKTDKRRLSSLTEKFDDDGTVAPPPELRIKPGSRLVREWHGRTYTVEVADDGFTYEGRPYRSLTRIAFEISGAQWSGPRFFGLTKTVETSTGAPNSTGATKATARATARRDDVPGSEEKADG